MKRLLQICLFLIAAVSSTAAIQLTATQAEILNLSVDAPNYFVKVEAYVNNSEYEIAFDLWPDIPSAIGSFTSSDRSISFVHSYVCKVRYKGEPLGTMYECTSESSIRLDITRTTDSTATLSGSIDAFAANGTKYTYQISDFTFPYSEDEVIVPEKDPYRFEPTQPTTIDFHADVVNFRLRDGYVEVTLNEMANEAYNWIELRLLSNALAMPAGEYNINNSGEPHTLTASKGYLSTHNDDPCYVAIRNDHDNWGSYTPYYLVDGTLQVSYNEKGDSLFITGQATSYYGTTVTIQAHSYNILYVPEEEPREPEKKTLDIDTVQITYLSNISDTAQHVCYYTFNFFHHANDYPNVLVDVIMPMPMALTEGNYSLADGSLSGLSLFQNQTDFNDFFFGGTPYVFANATLTIKQLTSLDWLFEFVITDEIGSEYRISLRQNVNIIRYPALPDDTNPEEKAYADEQSSPTEMTFATDILHYDDATVEKDGVLDITLFQSAASEYGLHAMVQLGMFTSVSKVPAGTYPINHSEDEGTFSASLGRFGDIVIPCYAALVDANGWVYAIWYLVDGEITISYSSTDEIIIQGECQSYYGSKICFSYGSTDTDIIEIVSPTDQPSSQKIMQSGQILILREGRIYTIMGTEIK